MAFEFEPQAIPDIILIKPQKFEDERGFFIETYKSSKFEEYGIPNDFRQDNQSRSMKGALRGLHYQLAPMDQGKLIRVSNGAVFDVVVDIRTGSPHFGKHVGVELSIENSHILWVPPGFAHGFLTLLDRTDFVYKVTKEFSPDHERSIRYNDETVNIDWPEVGVEHIVSARDQKAPSFDQAEYNFSYSP